MTAVAGDTTTTAFLYKHRYSDRAASELAQRDHAFLNQMPKEGGLDGADFNYPLTTGNPQGIADDFTSAQGAAETLKGVQLAAVPYLKYGDLTLDGPSLIRASGGKASFYDLVTRSQDGLLDELGAEIAFNLQRDRSGMRGRRASISGNIVTLSNKRDVEHFKRGMTVMACTAAGGSGARAGSSKVVGLNRTNGTITLDDQSTITTFSDNDYLFRKGGNATGIEGMETATPLSVPTAGDSFRGIDRSVDAEALAGSRIDDTSRYVEEILGDLATEIQIIAGKKGDRAVVFPTVFQAMSKRLGAKVEFMAGSTADIGFEYITIIAGGTQLRVMSDVDARYDRARIVRQDTHCIKHVKDFIHFIRDDGGGPNLRLASSDGIETRARFLGNYVQYDTAAHGVASVSTTNP
jgi:hypothetical protein